MPEILRLYPLDTVFALGNSTTPTCGKKQIEKSTYHLNPASEIVAKAAGYLYTTGATKFITFSTGHTCGHDLPAEAEAMDAYLEEKFPRIPKEARKLETKSFDSAGNAVECIKIAKENNFKNIGLLSFGNHAKNASKLFEYYGLSIPKENVFVAEKIVFSAHLSKSADEAYKFMRDCSDYYYLNWIDVREFVRSILLATIDPDGMLLRQITKRTRK
jgi:hypothetical protein